MTICYFGIYNPIYSRNRVLIKGLKQNGVTVIECRSEKSGLAKYWDLIKKHWSIKKDYDLMLVGFPGYQATILARLLTRKKIIFDAFASLYDSMVFDREIVRAGSLKARYYRFLDWLACRLADKILLDTDTQIDYFVKTFHLKKEKFIRVFVGADEDAIKLKRKERQRDYFLVHFHGSYIPLQGVEYILEAAKILAKENIKFNLIGSKIKEKFGTAGLVNVNFFDDVPYEKLADFMSEADICLGIFGDTAKAQRVIPNKVFEALAAARLVITGESQAAKELLQDGQQVLFCQMADANDLVKKIKILKENTELRERLASNGYELFKTKLTPQKLAYQFLEVIKSDKKNYV